MTPILKGQAMIRRVWIVNIGITLGFILIIWLLDAAFHFYLLQDKRQGFSFLFPWSDRHELILHLFIPAIFLGFGIILTLKNIKISKSEKELRDRTGQYRLIAEYSNDVIWKMNTEGKFLYVSPSVEKLRGFTQQEVVNQGAEEVLTPSSLKVYEGLLNRLKEVVKENPGRAPSVITELEQPCKNGTTVWTEASVTTVLGEDGNPAFFIGVSRDISERKQREDELRRSEEYYRLLAETSLDYILVHDMDGKIIYVNPVGIEASGYSIDDLMGRRITDLLPQKYHSRVEELHQLRLNGDFQTYKYEMEFLDIQGNEHPVEISSAPIVFNKTAVSIIISARDITERREAERKSIEVQKKIQQINIELENKVEERTHMLQEAYKELESFSYSVSHDLRAPLRHIDTFSKLLKKCLEGEDSDKCMEYLGSILESTKKMKVLIDSLLQLSRTGRANLRRQKIGMDLIVNQVIKEIELENDDQQVEWKIGELGEVKADPGLVKQVWFNLISNSVKFSREKEKSLIEIGKISENGHKTWFIKDNGVGFDNRYTDKLFGVFQRLHTEEEFEGTGIGLATVKRIIDRHRGKIWAESSPGEGAAFYFYLS